MPFTRIKNIPVWGTPLDNAVEQIVTCRETAAHAALMADHHLGYSMPIGGVCAYENQISPTGVGYDISCGNKAVRLDIDADQVRQDIKPLMDEIWNTLSFGVGLKNKEQVDHPLFEDDDAWDIPIARSMKGLAREQLGTIGSGNHYVDLFVDESDRVWIGAHFGSRGFGHRVATHFFRRAGKRKRDQPVLFDISTTTGQEYIACMKLAGRYAYAGRNWVCERVARMIGADIVEEIHNHHNFAWEEEHFGETYWVVRKGATPAFPGQKGFVGGSMGDISVILEGTDSDESAASLYSTIHGAGRLMSRTQAAGRKRYKKGKITRLKEGQISREMMLTWIGEHGVELRGAGTDESPHCYKRLPDVLDAHEGTIRVLHTLHPIGVAMAGEDEYDPYKD